MLVAVRKDSGPVTLEIVFLAMTGRELARLMSLTPIAAMVRKDLRLFLSDRRAVIMSFIVPIAIASFFGSIFSGSGSRRSSTDSGGDRRRRSQCGLDEHRRPGAGRRHLPGDDTGGPTRRGPRSGAERSPWGVMIPPGFGKASSRAFFTSAARPELTVWYDPSRAMEMAWCAAF